MDYMIYFQITRPWVGEMVPLDTHGVCLLRKETASSLKKGGDVSQKQGWFVPSTIYI
jgi:hypothetical protein